MSKEPESSEDTNLFDKHRKNKCFKKRRISHCSVEFSTLVVVVLGLTCSTNRSYAFISLDLPTSYIIVSLLGYHFTQYRLNSYIYYLFCYRLRVVAVQRASAALLASDGLAVQRVVVCCGTSCCELWQCNELPQFCWLQVAWQSNKLLLVVERVVAAQRTSAVVLASDGLAVQRVVVSCSSNIAVTLHLF